VLANVVVATSSGGSDEDRRYVLEVSESSIFTSALSGVAVSNAHHLCVFDRTADLRGAISETIRAIC